MNEGIKIRALVANIYIIDTLYRSGELNAGKFVKRAPH
jgi:hypothetical protein